MTATFGAEQGMKSNMGFKRTIAIAAIVLGSLSVLIATSLVVLTTELHRTSAVLRDTMRSARLARQVQVDLLLHERASDPTERATLGKTLHGALEPLRGSAMASPETRLARADAKRAVEAYLIVAATSAAAHTAELRDAMDAIDDLVHSTIRDSDRVSAGAARLDEAGDVVGIASIVVMLTVPALLMWWMKRAVAHPIVELSSAMNRFGQGDRSVRAEPIGAEELRRMISQFNAMCDHLENQHRARLTQLAGVAHDLRNPLSALRMSTSLMGETTEDADPTASRARLIMDRQLGRLTRMVDDLLDATRIEVGQLELESRDTDVRLQVRAATELFENVSPNHRITTTLPCEPLVVHGDAMRIEQVLINLLSNAIKYSPRGGNVDVHARAEGDAVLISVTDEGIGMATQELERIWAPFRRVGASRESIPGVGLGLWTSKKIVEAQGGVIGAKSIVGKGSTFTLRLPLLTSVSGRWEDGLSPSPAHG